MLATTMPFFDTHKYVRTLKEAGFTEAQAEAQSSALVGVLDAHTERLATKDDLKQLATELRSEIAQLRGEIAPLKWMAPASMIMLIGLTLSMAALMFKSFS